MTVIADAWRKSIGVRARIEHHLCLRSDARQARCSDVTRHCQTIVRSPL